MVNKVTLVTEPDDIEQDGLRILLTNLDNEQSQIISDSLTKLNYVPNTILYIWNQGDISWLIDKKHKSDFIIFNAESENEIITGYMSAQKNSAYFGTLKNLSEVNPRRIYNEEECTKLLQNVIGIYEQQ